MGNVKTMASPPPALTVYCLPVSGVAFPAQLGILAALSAGRKAAGQPPKASMPDVAIGSSGGNIVAYYALASDWNGDNMFANAWMIDHESFLTGWTDNIPSWLFLPFSRAVFRKGYGFASLFKRMFAPGQAKYGTEIWTGTLCHKTREHCVFTNKSQKTAILTPRVAEAGVNPHYGDSLQPVYLDGNLLDIAEVTQASASIPWIVKPSVFRGNEYSDGGGIFCSPLFAFDEHLQNLGRSGQRSLRLFYISPCNVDLAPRSSTVNLIKELSDMVRGSTSNDMKLFVNIITALSTSSSSAATATAYPDLSTPDQVGALLTDLEEKCIHFAVLLYPGLDKVSIELATKFHPIDIQSAMLMAKKSLKAYVWKIIA